MFKKRNLRMCRQVLSSLIQRGLIVSEEDALEKLQDFQWLADHGYSHVAAALQKSIDADECKSVFAECKKLRS